MISEYCINSFIFDITCKFVISSLHVISSLKALSSNECRCSIFGGGKTDLNSKLLTVVASSISFDLSKKDMVSILFAK